MKVRYIGNFPPPYGGVTIKNHLLLNELSKHMKIYCFKHKEGFPQKISQIISCLLSLLPNQKLIIGISSKGGKSLLQTKLLYYLNRNTMRRSIYFMMGGREAKRIAKDLKQQKMYKIYKQIYVETETMKKQLIEAGLNNVSIYPNCRSKPKFRYIEKTTDKIKKLRCVFFSLIQERKGVENIIIAAKELKNVEFTFYGEIDSDFKGYFINSIAKMPNVKYMGVFSGTPESVYHELAKYDLVLLPTKWKTEGVPGILVESKIAGLTCIVSNESYNSDIIKNDEEGIVLSENTPKKLIEAIKKLDLDRKLLCGFKKKNSVSAEKYYIENYIDDIVKKLRNKNECGIL